MKRAFLRSARKGVRKALKATSGGLKKAASINRTVGTISELALVGGTLAGEPKLTAAGASGKAASSVAGAEIATARYGVKALRELNKHGMSKGFLRKHAMGALKAGLHEGVNQIISTRNVGGRGAVAASPTGSKTV